MNTRVMPVGCFAPALSDEIIAGYEQLIAVAKLSTELREALERCLRCVKAWWVLPESTQRPKESLDVSVMGFTKPVDVVPLEPEHIEALWDVTPYPAECEYLKSVVEQLPMGTTSGGFKPVTGGDGVTRMIEHVVVSDPDAKKLRDAAFHLLWYTCEIARDREPLSQDKLG